jgi:hypothetical protein
VITTAEHRRELAPASKLRHPTINPKGGQSIWSLSNDLTLAPYLGAIHLIHQSFRSPPPKSKGQPKNKRRKTSGGRDSVEENSGTGVNDSGSSSSLAHSDVDKDVNSGMIIWALFIHKIHVFVNR